MAGKGNLQKNSKAWQAVGLIINLLSPAVLPAVIVVPLQPQVSNKKTPILFICIDKSASFK